MPDPLPQQNHPHPEPQQPHASEESRNTVAKLAFGAIAAHTVAVAARLDVRGRIGDGERSADDFAAECVTEPGTLARSLRAPPLPPTPSPWPRSVSAGRPSRRGR
ncbi:hypothetical protein ACFC0M_26935 [Streptomyces sp. NPDC056149]|uniref:hypothetical protein n=1 Tax=Streptomyces sp. NPDC056149 TaxID=3345728 RepID=UPI0035DBC987